MKKGLLILIVLSSSLLGGYLSPLVGITVFCAMTMALFLTLDSPLKLRKDELTILFFALYAAASVFYTQDKWGTILFSGSLLAGALFYVVLRNSSGWRNVLLNALLTGGCVAGLLETLRQVNVAPVALFYNPNPFSGFLTPIIPISVYLYARSRKTRFIWVTAFLLFSNLLSGSRSGIVTMTMAFCVLFFYFWKKRDKGCLEALGKMLFLGFAAFLAFSFLKESIATMSPPGMTEKGTVGIVQRAYLLGVIWRLFEAAPVFGYGLNSFKGIMPSVINPYVIFPTIHAHSLYLNILVELGIVGVVIFLLFLLQVLKGPFFSTSFFFRLALLSFLVHNIVEYNFPAPAFQMLFYLLAALVMEERPDEQPVVVLTGWKEKVALRVVLLYFVVVHLSPVFGFLLLGRADAALRRGDPEKTYRYLALSTYFGYSISNFYKHMGFLLGEAFFATPAHDRELLRLAEKNYLRALALNRLDGDLYVEIAEFYSRTGRISLAENYLKELAKRYPHYQKYRVATAGFYAGQGRTDEAVRILLESDEFLKRYAPLDPTRVAVFFELARNYRKLGDTGRYEEFMGKAVRLQGLLEAPEAGKRKPPA